jgi:hypothetical protein
MIPHRKGQEVYDLAIKACAWGKNLAGAGKSTQKCRVPVEDLLRIEVFDTSFPNHSFYLFHMYLIFYLSILFSSSGTLIATLASAYDQLLPALLRGLRALQPADGRDVMLTSAAIASAEQRRVRRARAKVALLAWLLLEARLLGGASAEAGAKSAGGFAPRNESPAQRGSALVEVVTSMGQEHEKGDGGVDEGRRGALLRTLDSRKDLRGIIRRLQASGELLFSF